MRTREFLVSAVESTGKKDQRRKLTVLTGKKRSIKSTEVTFDDAIDLEMSPPSM